MRHAIYMYHVVPPHHKPDTDTDTDKPDTELVTLKKDHLLLLETHPSVLKYVSPSNVKLHNVWLPKSVAFKCDTAVAMGYDGSTLANVM